MLKVESIPKENIVSPAHSSSSSEEVINTPTEVKTPVDPKYYQSMERYMELPKLSYAMTELYLGLARDVISSAEWLRFLSGFRFIPSV